MRVLPARSDDAGSCSTEFEAQTYRCGYRLRDAGQHLPVWNIPADPASDQAGSGGEGMTAIVPSSRREFLEKIFSAGALVIAAPLLPAQEAAISTGSGGIWQPSVYLG